MVASKTSVARAALALTLVMGLALPAHALVELADGGPSEALTGAVVYAATPPTTDPARAGVLTAPQFVEATGRLPPGPVDPELAAQFAALKASTAAPTPPAPISDEAAPEPPARESTSAHERAPRTAGPFLMPAPAPTQAAPERGFDFVCAEPDSIGPITPPVGSAGGDPVVYGCPIRVYDQTYSFGNPKVVVHHDDHRETAFFALHGPPARDGQHDYSRTGQTHVTFTSGTQGLSWADQPTPNGIPGGSARGELPSGTMDSNGNLYASYLWSQPLGDGAYDHVIGLFKGPDATNSRGMLDSYSGGFYIPGREIGNAITWQSLERLAAYVPPLNESVNQTQEPTTEEDNGEAAVGDLANATDERVVLVWHEAAYDWTNTSTGMSAWIDAAWSDISGKNKWDRLNDTQLIGPCREASNTVAWAGKMYVACVVERGYTERDRARVGDIDLYEINPHTGNTSLVADTGVQGGRPILAVTEDGYFSMLVESHLRDKGGNLTRLKVEAAFSWEGKNWERLGGDIGPELRRIGGGENVPLRDAHITGLAISTDEKTSFLVYKEWHDDPQEIETQEVDPNGPITFIGDTLTDYNKYVISYNRCGFGYAGSKFELGTAVDQTNANAYAESDGAVFNDVQDGLFVTREPNGEELVYFAVNDYGAVQYGAILPTTASSFCPVGFPPPPLPPPPVPAALTIVNPAATALASVMAVPMVAGIGYLLTVKRRVATFVTAEDE